MVDAISGGRLEFGVGSGNTGLDYRVFAIPREENSRCAEEVATQAILRYDEISRIGRREDSKIKSADWPAMLATGRNLYGNPDQCIQVIHNAMKHYSFNILTNTFNFGGMSHDMIKKSMRLFAREVMPAFH